MIIKTLADLRVFLVDCRDSHLGTWDEKEVAARVGDKAFHDACIREYNEAIDVLTGFADDLGALMAKVC